MIYALRQWIKGGQFTEKVNGNGKVAIVTGASSGIGKQLVRELNLKEVKIYLACRSIEKGQEAARELFSKYGCDPTRMCVRQCDLADFSSIRRFVEEFDNEESKLDILVNNAGVMGWPKFERTVDGHEYTWQTNYLGHFLLTELLLPKLELSPDDGGRIVNLSSRLHLYADTVEPDVCESARHYDRWLKTYARSKLAMLMHCVALTKRIRANNSASKVTANACHPGGVDTAIYRNYGVYWKFMRPLFAPLFWFTMKTDQDGAQTPLFLALSPSVSGVSGKYFRDCKQADTHPLAQNELACEILYNNSLEQCGLISRRTKEAL